MERVYTSPAIRCRETATVLFPGQTPKIVENFWEIDFGTLENKPVDCTQGAGFEKWLAQDPDCGFPEGETVLECRFCAMAAMTRVIKEAREEGLTKVAVIAHGEVLGCLMQAALVSDISLEEFTLTPNGMGYEVNVDMDEWFWGKPELHFVKFLPEGAERPKAEDSPFFAKKEEKTGE